MSRVGLRLLCMALAAATAFDAGAAGNSVAVLKLELKPAKLSWNAAAILMVAVETPGELQGATLEVVAPPGFTINPRTAPVGSAAGARSRQFDVQPPRNYIASSEMSMTVVLSDKSGELASRSIAFEFESGIGTVQYLLAGIVGIVLGYLARIFVDILQALPKPVVIAAASAAASVPDLGRVTIFVREHYYLTDFLVSLVLGFLALVALLKDGHPPDSSAYWYSALLLGFGLGVLTNSDLITRLRTR